MERRDSRSGASLVALEVTNMSIQQPLPETVPAPTLVLRPERGRRGIFGGRPMWLIWPSITLLVVIIGIPLLIAIYISFLNLDQYTLRVWIQPPWVGLGTYVTAPTAGNVIGASALTSLGGSLAFSVLTPRMITPTGL